jgi:hypothetical protein
MNPENDNDLKQRFIAQRRADSEQAPAWNPRLIEAPIKEQSFHFSKVWVLAVTAAACLMVSLVLFHQTSTPDLVTALPSLFETPTEPLFASLDDLAAVPSDFLLPSHLTLNLP